MTDLSVALLALVALVLGLLARTEKRPRVGSSPVARSKQPTAPLSRTA